MENGRYIDEDPFFDDAIPVMPDDTDPNETDDELPFQPHRDEAIVRRAQGDPGLRDREIAVQQDRERMMRIFASRYSTVEQRERAREDLLLSNNELERYKESKRGAGS
jgi:hypothetical protein